MRIPLMFTIATLAFTTQANAAGDKPSGSIDVFKFNKSGEVEGQNSRSKIESDHLYVDIGFCYTMGSICLGFKYLDATETTTTTTTWDFSSSPSETVSETKFGGFGAKVGLSGEGFVGHYSYMLQPQMSTGGTESSSSTSRRYKVSSASVIDIGYGFKVKKLQVGPMLSMIDYKVSGYTDESGVETSVDYSYSYTVPYFSLWVDF